MRHFAGYVHWQGASSVVHDEGMRDGLLGAGDSITAGEMNPVHYVEEDIGNPMEVSLEYMRGTAAERVLFEGIWNAR